MPSSLEDRLPDFLIADPSSIIPVSKTSLLVSTWVATSLAAIFTALRSWLQFRHNGRWYANDYLLGIALFLHIALSVVISCATPTLYNGLNAVVAATVLNQAIVASLQPTFLKYQFSALILLWTALWTVKIAMLSFYLRLFNFVNSKARIFWWIIFGITIATWIVSIVLQSTATDPPSESFNPDAFVRPESIAGFNRAFHFAAISDILTDVMIMIVPLPLLRILQLPRSQKVVLLLIFWTPLFAIIFAILNLVFDSIKTFGPTINPIRLLLYSTLEVSLIIITACLPSLRLYFKARQGGSLTIGRLEPLRLQDKITPHRSIDWGAMVLQPITKSKSRPLSQTVSMDHILSPTSPGFNAYERSNFSHENIGHAM